MTGNFGVAISGNKAFLILVENDGYTVEEYQCFDFGVADFKGCFSFSLETELYLCVKKTLYQFIKDQRTWKKLTYDMNILRYGTACVSLEQGTIIAGGCESCGNTFPCGEVKELKDSCVLIRRRGEDFITSWLGKLPEKLKYHTLTKVSNNSFILCGGINGNEQETREVYLGTLEKLTRNECEGISEQFSVSWIKLPRMRKSHAGHFSMFVDNRFHVFGGTFNCTEEERALDRQMADCGLKESESSGMIRECLPLRIDENGKLFVDKWKMRHMAYDVSFSTLVLSPDRKYGVIAGGNICGYCDRRGDYTQLTMNTHNLVMRSLEDRDKSIHTNNILKIIFSFSCMTPMYDDVDREFQDPRSSVEREFEDVPSPADREFEDIRSFAGRELEDFLSPYFSDT